jgi:type II secretory pathway component PulJ
MLRNRSGFTVMELLIFSAIFSVITITFIAILVAVTKVHVEQGSASEVNGQSQFLLQTLQTNIEQSSLIEMASDTASSSLKLRMSTSSIDPTIVTLSNGIVYLTQGTSTAQALTTDKVAVSNLTFTKHANANGAHDSVAIAFTISYNTTNVNREFAQLLQTSIARVSAATFDSNIVPSTNNTYKLGASAQQWTSINDTLYFLGTGNTASVGLGVSNPYNTQPTLEINGGLRLNTSVTKPTTCVAGIRGMFWVTENGTGVKDNVEVCAKDASNNYAWRTIY